MDTNSPSNVEKSKSRSRFFIYGLYDPDGELRYIGKCQTSLYRRLQSHKAPSQLNCNIHKSNWIKNLLAAGDQPTIHLLQELHSADDLVKAETYWINYFDEIGCRLTNISRVEGRHGFSHSLEVRRRISERMIGNSHAKGFKHTLETRAKISKAVTGIKRSPEVIKAMSARAKISSLGNQNTLGYIPTEETRKKLSIAARGRKHTAEAKAKMSAKLKGKSGRLGWKHSDDTKRKISEAMKRHFDKLSKS